jgi:hypothetical protein
MRYIHAEVQHGYPPHHHPPAKSSNVLLWVLLAIGCMFAFGIAGCAVAFYVWTAKAREMSKGITDDPSGSAPQIGASEPGVKRDRENDEDEDDEVVDDRTGDRATDPRRDPEPTSSNRQPSPPPPPAANKPPSSGNGSGRVTCSAMGSFRACGFANVCTNQTASGVGTGSSEPEARAMAVNFCNGSIRARGGSGMCSVTSCSHN